MLIDDKTINKNIVNHLDQTKVLHLNPNTNLQTALDFLISKGQKTLQNSSVAPFYILLPNKVFFNYQENDFDSFLAIRLLTNFTKSNEKYVDRINRTFALFKKFSNTDLMAVFFDKNVLN